MFRTAVEHICGERDFYRVDHDNPRILDDMWARYEGRLNVALDRLVDRSIDARLWANTVVPFVTALMVRGRDFEPRLNQRLITLFGPGVLSALHPDNAKWTRLMELQRLQSSVLGARWTLHTIAGSNLSLQITSDLGWLASQNREDRSLGITVPIDLNHVLTVTPTTAPRVVAIGRGGLWRPVIRYATLGDTDQQSLVRSLAFSAQRFVIGPDELTMERYVFRQGEPPRVPEPGMLGFMTSRMARHFEHVRLFLADALSTPPRSDGDVIGVSYAKNAPTGPIRSYIGVYTGIPE